MVVATKPFLTDDHARTLEESAIPADAARAWGIKSVLGPEDLLLTDLDHPGVRGRTGILFPLHMLGTDVRGNPKVTYQLRQDHPDEEDDGKGGKRARKYIQAGGVGAIFNVPQMMLERLGVAKRIAIVEGTKQTVAASLNAPDDVLVVGIQGCANFSHAGLPDDEKLRSALPVGDKDVEVFICFDADWKKNPNVWEAAKRLKGFWEGTIGVSKPVRVTNLTDMGVSGKNGLDDWLGKCKDPAERPGMFARLLDRATPNLGQRPAAKSKAVVKADANVKVDFDQARIVEVKTILDSSGSLVAVNEETLLGAAARIVESEAHVDEETGEPSAQRLTLEVFVKVDDRDTPVRHRVKVPSGKLADLGAWLDRLPDALGVKIGRSSKPDDKVANAIRAVDSDITTVTVVPRTGWKMDSDGTWRWCDGYGGIGPDDKITSLRGEPASKDFQAIKIPGPGDASEARFVEGARALLGARGLFKAGKEFNWDVAIAGWGLAFLGITPNAAVCWFGPPSSGKSTVAQALASSLSRAWAPTSVSAMATFNARPAGMDLLPNGLSNCFLHVDDLKPESDPQSMKNALKAFDALLRRAHGSGGAVRGEVDRERDSLGVRKIDNAAPMMFITGEEIPSGGDGFAESGLDRALFIQVEPLSLFTKPNLTQLQTIARTGIFTYATGSYLAWLSGRINAMSVREEEAQDDDPDAGLDDDPLKVAGERFDRWKAALDARRQRIYRGEKDQNPDEDPDAAVPDEDLDAAVQEKPDELFAKDARVSERAKMLAASLLLGYEQVMRWATDVGALSDEEALERSDEFLRDLRASVLSHTRDVMGGNVTASEQALAALQNAVSSQMVTLTIADGQFKPEVMPNTPADVANKPLIGDFRNLPGVGDVVAINHAMAASALRYPGGGRALLRALTAKCVLTEDGKLTRTLTVNGTRVQVCAIRYADWGVEARPAGDGF